MIYGAKIIRDGNNENILISAANDANALNILVNYCQDKLQNITCFKKLGEADFSYNIAKVDSISNPSKW